MTDFEKLLKPIRDDAATGDDLRYQDGDLTFREIEELRVNEDPALTIEGDAKVANWPKVVRTCEDALANKTKDLEIAAFLAEGLAHTEGFAGVRDGLRLQKELIQAFWERLHPGLDPDDGEIVLPIRAKPLNWLALQTGLAGAVKATPFVTGNPERALAWTDLQMSERVDAAQILSDQTQFQELSEAGHVTGEAFRMALSNTSREDLQGTFALLEECMTELQELTTLCDERFGDDDAPRLIALSQALDEIREHLEPLVHPEEAQELMEGGKASEAGEAVGTAGPLGSRQDALRTLGEVADFFRRTEPHTPISYLVQRAVRWGSMPLEDLLREVVKNDEALEHIWETLGISGGEDKE